MAKLSEQQTTKRALARRRSETLAAEADHERNEAERREFRENGMYLTREEVEAGEPCGACGLPHVAGLGGRSPLMDMTDEQRAEHDSAVAEAWARLLVADSRGPVRHARRESLRHSTEPADDLLVGTSDG